MIKVRILLLFAIFSIAAGSVIAACPSGMVSYWSFDNSQDLGNDDFDGNDGTLYNSPVWTSSGKVNGALQFNGDSFQYMVPPNSIGNFGADNFAVEFWIQKAPFTIGAVLTSNKDGGVWHYGSNQYIIFFDLAQNLHFMNSGYSQPTYDCAIPGISTGWAHIAFVRNGNTLKGYENGVEACTSDVTGAQYIPLALAVGRTDARPIAYGLPLPYPSQSSYYLTGTLDEFAIYHEALSQQEIQDHYNNGAGIGYCEEAPPGPGAVPEFSAFGIITVILIIAAALAVIAKSR